MRTPTVMCAPSSSYRFAMDAETFSSPALQFVGVYDIGYGSTLDAGYFSSMFFNGTYLAPRWRMERIVWNRRHVLLTFATLMAPSKYRSTSSAKAPHARFILGLHVSSSVYCTQSNTYRGSMQYREMERQLTAQSRIVHRTQYSGRRGRESVRERTEREREREVMIGGWRRSLGTFVPKVERFQHAQRHRVEFAHATRKDWKTSLWKREQHWWGGWCCELYLNSRNPSKKLSVHSDGGVSSLLSASSSPIQNRSALILSLPHSGGKRECCPFSTRYSEPS